jgi:hypothetical protein
MRESHTFNSSVLNGVQFQAQHRDYRRLASSTKNMYSTQDAQNMYFQSSQNELIVVPDRPRAEI